MQPALSFVPPVIGHRGASAYAPENTLAAFAKAKQLGVNWVEFDVMLSADGVPVVFHDETLERTTNAQGELVQCPYGELARLDAGAWFDPIYSSEPIPTLQAVVEFLITHRLRANVELKPLPGQEEKLVKQVLKVLQPYFDLTSANQQFLFSSFSPVTLMFMRRHAPHSLLGLLLHEWDAHWQVQCEKLACVSVHVNHEALTQVRAQQIKSAGKYLLSYTVNEPALAQALFSWGVDAVFSDAPDRILK